MDPRLLRLYTDELTHLREIGAEFAHEFPRIAGRLGMDASEGPVADPYVERLLEGFAFMAARVQLKLEAEQPRLIAQLLETIYPNFLAPVPSMLVARITVDPTDPNLLRGHAVPRGSVLTSEAARGQGTRCEFRTAHALTLWPIELAAVQFFTYAPDLPLAGLPQGKGEGQADRGTDGPKAGFKGGLRIRLRAGEGVQLRELPLDCLAFYISAPTDVAFRLHELLLGCAAGSWITAAAGDVAAQWRGADSVQPLGFEASEALLPDTLRAFSGYRVLQEVAAMPQRALFFEVHDLAARLARVEGREAELVVLFTRADPALEPLVDVGSLALHCTPAINLFPKRLDRIQLGTGTWEYHAVPDGTRPMDFEVHSVESLVGYGTGAVAQQDFLPLYATRHDDTRHAHGFFTLRREPRLLSPKQKQNGPRSAYVGEEVFISLVDPRHAPYRDDVRQLAVSAWVTNRDLPTLLPIGSAIDAPPLWRLDVVGPVARVDAIHGPTRPVTRRPTGEMGWSLVNHLALNHASLLSDTPQQAAASVRAMLKLYGPPDDAAWARHVDGVLAVHARTTTRRLPFKGPLSFGAGVAITVELDELAYQGMSAFLFATMLERFFARHAAINSFTQFTLRTPQRREDMRWPVRAGLRQTA